jgi:hypothetical protein
MYYTLGQDPLLKLQKKLHMENNNGLEEIIVKLNLDGPTASLVRGRVSTANNGGEKRARSAANYIKEVLGPNHAQQVLNSEAWNLTFRSKGKQKKKRS